uniref:Uncharacterized protein n=1 Tax=Glossina brevipalpis TaxID=37001 RepID=A0A1A9W540_9MUSC
MNQSLRSDEWSKPLVAAKWRVAKRYYIQFLTMSRVLLFASKLYIIAVSMSSSLFLSNERNVRGEETSLSENETEKVRTTTIDMQNDATFETSTIMKLSFVCSE